MYEKYFAELNDNQKLAVSSPEQTLIVLAGAGSGKTRVLTHRVAWLSEQCAVSPYSILAVTFTNKAAAEMRSRIEQLLGFPAHGLWIGTFHGLAHRLLRAHWQQARLEQHFQILDSDDQFRLIKRLLKANNIDDTMWPPKQVQWFINNKKDEGLRAKDLSYHSDNYNNTLINIYELYQTACDQSSLVDFSELLLRCYELLQQNTDVLNHYQQRFSHILVDEFQDTNTIQYAWLKLLATESTCLTIVGDDDQSIYGWRGAKVENIYRFQRDYPNPQIIKLEQNYRSTGNILNAANAVIANNDRLGKNLWTSGHDGEKITLYAAFNEIDEARFIAARIKDWCEQAGCRREIAILYRSNAQSRIIEETLLQSNIAYRVYGGFRFFERAEIKDALAYLRLLVNRNDDAAFERVVNTPTRGIGERTLSELRDHARSQFQSLWQAASFLVKQSHFSARANNALQTFLTLIDSMQQRTADLTLDDQIGLVIQMSRLVNAYEKEGSEKAHARIENLDELINAAAQYSNEDSDMTPLDGFLSYAVLESGETQGQADEDCVHLMTLHSAKGLEFPLVFMTGVEEELFPHQRSSEDLQRLQEERRLCYVGITRAMQKLYLTYAEYRRLHGRIDLHHPSRFIKEIPDDLVDEVRPKTTITKPFGHNIKQRSLRPSASSQQHSLGFRIGQTISHPKFGEGVILNFEGQGSQTKVQVQFADTGLKWLVAAYANLTAV